MIFFVKKRLGSVFCGIRSIFHLVFRFSRALQGFKCNGKAKKTKISIFRRRFSYKFVKKDFLCDFSGIG